MLMQEHLNKIALKEILKLKDLKNVKIRFVVPDSETDPLDLFKNDDQGTLLKWQYHNSKKKAFREGQVTIGFVRIDQSGDRWLLFHVGKVTRDLDRRGEAGYEWEVLEEYRKYFGRLIIKFKNSSQNMIRWADTVLDECEVLEILPHVFDHDIFPGYDRVNLSWQELKRVISKEGWKAALENQNGVYLITDSKTGKMYVGAAYGESGIWGRWQSYIETGHGGNVELKNLDPDYIRQNFRYSILDIFKSTIDEKLVRERESWWKSVLLTREFGFNGN